MISDFPAILDACVLVQAAVRDTLLRLYERRLFLARWTDEIIDEIVRTFRALIAERIELNPIAWAKMDPGYAVVAVQGTYSERKTKARACRYRSWSPASDT